MSIIGPVTSTTMIDLPIGAFSSEDAIPAHRPNIFAAEDHQYQVDPTDNTLKKDTKGKHRKTGGFEGFNKAFESNIKNAFL